MITLVPLAILAPPQAEVLFVHPTQGPYREIRDAVDAAVDGDVVLVAPGQYGHFGVIGKGLTILPRTAGVITVTGTVRVQGVPADGTVTLKGLSLNGPTPSDHGLRCASNHGAVRIEDCTVHSTLGLGAYFTDCNDITLVDFVSTSGYSGLLAYDSNVSLYGGTFVGLSLTGTPWGQTGWPGIEIHRCQLVASSVQAVGGNGGEEEEWVYTCLAPPGAGGDAILAVDSVVELLDVSLVPGWPGIPWSGYCPPSPPGSPVGERGTTTVTWHNGTALALAANDTGHAAGGVNLFVSLLGEFGSTGVLLVGPTAAHTTVPGLTGPLLIGGGLGAVRRIPLGPVPAVRSFVLPQLPNPYGIEELCLQAMQIQSSGIVLGPPRVLTVLGSAW